MMEFAFWLFFAHFVGDFALQSAWMAEHKSKLWLVMFAHVFIWTGCIMIPVRLCGHTILPWWPIMFVVHYALDWMKMYIFDGLKDQKGTEAKVLFYIDQFGHVAQLIGLIYILEM